MTGTTLRPMQEADADEVSAVVCACLQFPGERQNYTPSQISEVLAMHSTEQIKEWLSRWEVVVAERDGILVGVLAVEFDEIEALFVDPSCHRQGVGAALFAAAERSIASRRHPLLRVHTTGYGSPFYEAMGAPRVGAKVVEYGPLKGRSITCHEKPLT